MSLEASFKPSSSLSDTTDGRELAGGANDPTAVADGSSAAVAAGPIATPPAAEEKREERELDPFAGLRARLEAGELDGHAPVRLSSAATITDVPRATRRDLADATGRGATAVAARARLEQLAAILRAEGMDL